MAAVWRFGEFELDPDNHVLRRRGSPVRLAPQPFKLLLLLVSRSGALVRRDELHQALWTDGVSVDFDHGLNTCMRQVRAALGDDAADSRIIETIPRIGYRIKIRVTRFDASPDRRLSRTAIWLTVAATTVMMAGAVILQLPRPPAESARRAADAQTLYVRGRASLDRGTAADVDTARRLFSEAAQLSPSSPEPRAGVALSYLTHPSARAGVPPSEARDRAAEALAPATTADSASPVVGVAVAELELARGQWTAAESRFLGAIAQAPRDASL